VTMAPVGERRGAVGEEISATRRLPADAIRTGEAIELLAGKKLRQGTTAYIRHQARLARSVKRGRLTEYRRLGPGGVPHRHPRYYSRAEVLALRVSLERDGFTAASPSAYQRRTVQAITRRAEDEGLIRLDAAAELAGVTIAAARRWTQRGRFSARKIDGLWFFERAEVAAYRRPAAPQPSETIPCAFCGGPVTRQASKVRQAREVATKAGHEEPLVFCPECWANEPEARSLAHSRCKWRRGYRSPGRSRGMKAQWANGQRDLVAHRERNRQAWRSPKTAVDRADKSARERHGRGLSPERQDQVARKAMSRATKASQRSAKARELEANVARLWPTGMSGMAIANELYVTPQRVGQVARDLGLPRRPRGRPARM
jgi:hypothetical protein